MASGGHGVFKGAKKHRKSPGKGKRKEVGECCGPPESRYRELSCSKLVVGFVCDAIAKGLSMASFNARRARRNAAALLVILELEEEIYYKSVLLFSLS